MKTLQKERRPLSQKEMKALKKVRNTNQNVLKRGYKWPNVVAALILAAICVYGATWTRYDLVTFLLGVSAFFSLGYVIFMPYEAYKDIRRAKKMIRKIDSVMDGGTVEVTPVKATRVAMAKEHEDEGDLYLVEVANDQLLYVWDFDHNLRKGFPCLEFEFYDEEFQVLIGRQINPISEKIKPIVIDSEGKWNYLKKFGSPGHMEIRKGNFDRIIEKMGGARA